MIMSLFVVMPHTAGAAADADGVWRIYDAEDLLEYAQTANGQDNNPALGYNIELMADIDVSEYADRLRIGSNNSGYHGVFDGNGHTIKGLTHLEKNESSAGLFVRTTGGTIKNLVIDDADIKSDSIGGILVGRADDTNFLNISIRNSDIEIYTNGAPIGLITFGGMTGGAIIGEMCDSVMYNCESVNTNVFIDCGGIQALGGNNIFLGGLVGGAIAQDTKNTIEYSRVIRGKVSNSFTVGIGALGGQVLYSGGIAGYVQGKGNSTTEIIDCFSSSNVSSHALTPVSVASGITSYCAGIAAGAWGKNMRLEKCHYAGNLSSYLYNAAVVFPIIQENYYLYGILGAHDGVTTDTVKNCYYDFSKRPPLKLGGVTYDNSDGAVKDESDNVSWSGLSHSAFTNQAIWSSRNFDFVGNEISGTGCDEFLDKQGVSHTNKWIIDYNAEMPVHGKSVSVGTDFPNAGTVSIGAEGYRDGLSTESGYVSQITDTYDDTVTLTATVNPGYNFEGWYEGQINNDGTVSITGDEPLTKDTTYNASADDNAVYVAHYTANINFTDVGGNNVITTIKHSYNESLKFADAKAEEGQQFYGWTRDKNKSKTEATQNDINATTFVAAGTPVTETMTLYPVYIGVSANIHAVFEATGTDTLVIDAVENSTMNTVIESDDTGWYVTFNFGDSEAAVPEGYMFDGWYRKDYSQSEAGSTVSLDDAVCVSRDEKYYIDEDEIFDQNLYIAKFKYKVTAWMPEEIETRGGNVSDFYYVRGRDVDLSPYAEVWVDHGTDYDGLLTVLGKPGVGQDTTFHYWSAEQPEFNHGYDGSGLDNLKEKLSQYDSTVVKPMILYGVITIGGNGIRYNKTSFITYTDFPGAASSEVVYQDGGGDWGRDAADVNVILNKGYNFYGMLHYSNGNGGIGHPYTFNLKSTTQQEGHEIIWDQNKTSWTLKNTPYGNFSFNNQEYVLLKASASVNQYNEKGVKTTGYNLNTGITTVDNRYNNPSDWDNTPTMARKYQSLIFKQSNNIPAQNETTLDRLEEEDIATRDYPVGVGEAAKTKPVTNYKFLGWVDMNQMREIDKTYLFDVSKGTTEGEDVQYITSDSKKALGYVMKDDERVYAPMELYPLYAKYKVNITTNIGDDAGLGENKPNPGYEVSDDGSLVIKPDENVTVTVGDITLVDEDGNEIELVKGEDGNYTPKDPDTKLDVDEEYEVKIEYNYNVNVTYHVGGETEPYTESKKNGDTLGETVNTKLPELTVENGVFLGWTELETAPGSGYVAFNKKTDTLDMLVTSETVVNKNMDLYPVYVTIAHSANIDTDSENYTTLETGSKLVAETADGYSFDGWYAVMPSESGTENVSVARLLEYTVTKEYAVKAESFLAVYRPIVTYMIPVYGDDGTSIIYHDTDKYTAAVDYGHAITDGTEGIDPSVSSRVSISLNNAYEVTGWSANGSGSTQTPYTGPVTGPITLYPILKKVENTHTVSFVYKVNDEDGTVKDETISIPNVRDDTELSFEKITALSYTENGKTYVFSHWTTDGDENQYKGDMTYTVNDNVTFTAQYVEEVKTPYTVYSNWDDASSMPVTFASNVFPDERMLTDLAKGTGEGITFIGYALVTLNSDGSRTNDGLYAAGDALPEKIEDYGGTGFDSNTHRIYAVWAQIDTAKGASLRLTWENGADTSGMRVMGYVNTKILERVGLNIPDEDYKRGMYFSNTTDFDEQSPFIDTNSKTWHGNNYRTMFEDGFTSADGVNAFSIIAKLTDEQYELPLSFRAWLRFTYADEETKTAYGTFDAEANNRTISDVASIYLDDLKKQNDNADPSEANNWYGLGKPAYDKLAAYAGQDTTVPAAE